MDSAPKKKKKKSKAERMRAKRRAGVFFRFILFAGFRFAFFFPVFFYSHIPTIVPDTSFISAPIVIVSFVAFYLFLIYHSLLDARGAKRAFISRALFYAVGAYALLLWYPMMYIVNHVLPWFFPLLFVTAAWVFLNLRESGKPALQPALRLVVMSSCAAFVVAMEVFVTFQPCGAASENPALKFYIANCPADAQLIPEKTLRSKLSPINIWWMKKRHRSTVPAGGMVYLGASSRLSLMYDLNRKSLTTVRPDGGFISMAADAATNRVFMASNNEKVVRILRSGGVASRTIDYSGIGSPYWLEIDEDGRKLFTGFGESKHTRIIVSDLDTIERMKEDTLEEKGEGSIVDTTFSKPRRTVYFIVLFNAYRVNYVGAYDLDKLRMTRSRDLDRFETDIAYSDASDTLFMSSPITRYDSGELLELNPETLATIAGMKVPVGSREIAVGADGLVYLANYLTGEIYKIDWKEREIVDTIRVGRKIKRLLYVPRENALAFTSERGYGRIDLDEWRGRKVRKDNISRRGINIP